MADRPVNARKARLRASERRAMNRRMPMLRCPDCNRQHLQGTAVDAALCGACGATVPLRTTFERQPRPAWVGGGFRTVAHIAAGRAA